MRVTVNVPRERMSYRFRVGKRKFLSGIDGPQETFFAHLNPKVGQQEIILHPADFLTQDKTPMKDWNEISTFRFGIYDGNAKANLHFTEPENLKLISKIEWIKP